MESGNVEEETYYDKLSKGIFVSERKNNIDLLLKDIYENINPDNPAYLHQFIIDTDKNVNDPKDPNIYVVFKEQDVTIRNLISTRQSYQGTYNILDGTPNEKKFKGLEYKEKFSGYKGTPVFGKKTEEFSYFNTEPEEYLDVDDDEEDYD